jgi:glycerol-3-phosphate dehydrogenase
MTMAKVFADAGSDVTIHARRPEVVAETNVRHQNARYLPDVVLPDRLRATVDPVETLYRRTAEISPPGRSSLCGGVLIGRP